LPFKIIIAIFAETKSITKYMYGLSDETINSVRNILATIPEIEEAVIYGSRARGDNKPTSDIDIALKGQHLTIKHVALLDEKLDYLYLPLFFDTCILADLKNQDLIDNIGRNGKVIYHHAND
jgi:predicted nucleotidyltransferase